MTLTAVSPHAPADFELVVLGAALSATVGGAAVNEAPKTEVADEPSLSQLPGPHD